MNQRWCTIVTLIHMAVLWSLVRSSNVCFADGFKAIVSASLGNYGLSCPSEVSLQFDHKLPLESRSTERNSTDEKSPKNCSSDRSAPASLKTSSSILLSDTTDGECSKRSSKESHQPIATFDEWTKEKLKHDHRKFSPSPSEIGLPSFGSQHLSPSTATTRNYASKECGAKVLLSNLEAENTKAILSEKEKDEYMRNPCEKAEYKFVIIELCETIQLRSIELANYELFSSGPRTIRLWFAERFPAGEWQLITELTAIDSRQIQQFPITSNGIYIKFLKMELLSHYGNEHYCTLSVLKVLGTSMIDEYEAEAEAASVVHARNNIASVVDKKANETLTKPIVTTTTTDSLADRKGDEALTGPSETSGIIPKTWTLDPVIGVVKGARDNLISQFVDVPKDNLSRIVRVSDNMTRKFEMANPFEACYLCPKSGRYAYTSQFCHAFVWKSSRHNSKRNETNISPSLSQKQLSNRSEKLRLPFFLKESDHICLVSLKRNQSLKESDDFKTSNSSYKKVTSDEKQQQDSRTVQATYSEAWPASSTSHKESVFMKLNKRIAALELNMSLSSEYLSELSRQYVAQTDEHHKHMKQAKEILDEAVEAVFVRVNETFEKKIALLRQEVETLSYWLSSMRSTASKMTVGLFTSGAEKLVNEKCIPQQTQLHRYSPPDDDLWTSEQVAYMVVFTQLVTVLLFALLSFCYHRLTIDRHFTEDQRIELEELINGRIEDICRNNHSVLFPCVKQQQISAKEEFHDMNGVCASRFSESKNTLMQCSSPSTVQGSDDKSTSEKLLMGSQRSLVSSKLQVVFLIALVL